MARVKINLELRLSTQNNHTATHLLHTALRRIIGPHAQQAGSLVAPDHLRFDFTHHEKVDALQIEKIERMVNAAIRADYPVRWYEVPFKEAINSGITALFGEKYGEVVRVVHIGAEAQPYSRELCGGCHVARTGQLGLFRIVSESAAAAGVRRIEAVTGETALNLTLQDRRNIEQIQDLIDSRGSDPVEKLAKTLAEKRELEKELEHWVNLWASQTAREMLASAKEIDGVHITVRSFEPMDIERLKLVGDALRAQNRSVAALLISPTPAGAGQLCCVVGEDAISVKKLKAGDLVGKAAKLAGGGGGGKPHMATAGTKKPDLLEEAAKGFEKIVMGS